MPSELSEERSSRGRVLLVDDEQELARGYARHLVRHGFTVDLAHDGQQAAELARTREYDVIVSDIGLPRLDGLQLLRVVRAHDLDVPVILITGRPEIDTAIQAVEYGAMRYLRKPIRSEALLEIVEYATRLHRIGLFKREALQLLGASATQAGDRAGLEVSFDRALASLWMAFQPIVCWSARQVFGYEALVRTTEPSLPHPGALFDAAERLDRLPELGRAIRNHTAAVAEALPEPQFHLFVNLHPRDLLDDTLYSDEAPLSRIARRVVLEITERSSLDDVRDVRSRVEKLRSIGFRVAIDDLGAGYAGLTSFANLQPEVVKLDMSLVRDVHREPTKQKLIGMFIDLCGQMGMKVVAEGIETAEERDQLVKLGCDLLQGYLFARPGRPFPAVAW